MDATVDKSVRNRTLYGALIVAATTGIIYYITEFIPIIAFLMTVGKPGYEQGPEDGLYVLVALYYSVMLFTLVVILGLAVFKLNRSPWVND